MSIFNRENLKFAQRWLSNPLRMGTFLPLPSKAGKELIKQMPKLSKDGYVLELGSGSGSLTRFLYEDKDIDKRIICLEIDSKLCEVLRSKFSGIEILNQSAADFEKNIDQSILSKVEVIVSSIPFLTLDQYVKKQIFQSCSSLLNKGAVMFHVSYTPLIPVKCNQYNIKRDFIKTLISIPIIYLQCYKNSNSTR